MKRILITLLSFLLLFSLLLTACTPNQKEEDETESTSVSENETESETQAEETQTQPETTTFAPNPPITPADNKSIVGVSAKGYTIIEVNGLTYINGILVVNKTYSLPKDYNPGGLTPECKSAFADMQTAAAADGANLFICSGFRSYETQKNLYERYCRTDGQKAADTYSARPSYSEHQTGLAIDVNSVAQSFANTYEGKWLKENCWKYGFIMRYPEDKQDITGYCYEPWHVRYVGIAAAKEITESGLCLEEYLGITSVYSSPYEVIEQTTKPAENTTKAPETTTKAPVTTTVAPETTTKAPVTTTVAPETTTKPQETTTLAPETTTKPQETTTLAPETTTKAEETTVKADEITEQAQQ